MPISSIYHYRSKKYWFRWYGSFVIIKPVSWHKKKINWTSVIDSLYDSNRKWWIVWNLYNCILQFCVILKKRQIHIYSYLSCFAVQKLLLKIVCFVHSSQTNLYIFHENLGYLPKLCNLFFIYHFIFKYTAGCRCNLYTHLNFINSR